MKNTDNTLQDLRDKSFTEFNLVQGSLIKANVVEVGKKWVTLDIGFKSDGKIKLFGKYTRIKLQSTVENCFRSKRDIQN